MSAKVNFQSVVRLTLVAHAIIPPVQIVQRVIQQPKDLRIFKLENERGYVVFQVVDGKLISKMVDAAVVAKMMNTVSLG